MIRPTKLTPEFRKNLLQKNQAAFKKYNPIVYEILANHQPSSQLVFDDDGKPDVIVDGKPLFDGRAEELATEQLEAFRRHPTHLALAAPAPGQFDRYGNPLLKNVLDRAKADGIGFSEGLPSGDCFFLLVFGIGLGHHIDALVKETHPYVIQFVEPNLDNLFHSLQVYPWHTLLERQADRNGAVYITINNHPEVVTTMIQSVIKNCPPGLDGMACFQYSDPENAKIAIDLLCKNMDMILDNLGFLFDEIQMLKNTYLNLSSGSANIFVRAEKQQITVPVFVIGAGPSLDQDIDFIRDNADKAIIISTGTALRSLLVNGITPDFHVEMENVHVYSSINQLAKEYDLSSMCFVAPTTIEPHIIKFFDDIVYFFRPTICPYPLFVQSDAHSLRVAGPLVVNASFSLALEIGARDIYLFGTDFGFRGEGLDHAKDNVLFTDEAVIPGDLREYDISVPANFEGQFYVSMDFFQGLKFVCDTILFYGGDCRFFNCSDGARVEGATPIRARDLRLKGSAKRKQRDMRRIRNKFTVMTDEWFDECWVEDRLRDDINAFADGALAIMGDAGAFQDKGYLARYMVHTRRAPKAGNSVHESQRGDTVGAVASMFRGSLDKILTALRYYLGRVSDPEKEPQFHKIVAEELSSAIEAMRHDALAMIDDPTDILPAKAAGSWKDEDFIQEAYYTWSDTPRNAPCPCGSGKRYKHCHGKKN